MTALSRLKELLWILATVGVVAIVVRLLGGLGAVTDLSDTMPWGMWKIFNMVAGVAIATGGFALAATVYVFKLERFRPVLKPAVVIAFLGYGSSCFALVMDIGLPHAFYKPIIFWNHHSFLFEVAWCVMLYFSVTALEVAPTVLEQHGLHKLVRLLHRVTLPLVIVGITLSSLHHTSLGSLFVAMPARLHPLWFTSWLPWLFILSAVGSGIFMVIAVTLAYGRLYRRPVDLSMLGRLGSAGAVILGLYLIGKILDLVLRGELRALVSGQWEEGFFVAELLLGAVIPIVLVALPRARRSAAGLATAACSAVAGTLLNRLNVGITGLVRTAGASYFPSLAEIALSVGAFAAAALVFFYLVENYRVFENTPAREHLAALEGDVKNSDAMGRVWALGPMASRTRISLVVVVAASAALGLFSTDALEGMELRRTPVQAPRGVDATRSVLALNGDRDEDVVLFPHETHKQKLGGQQSCPKCHHQNLPHDEASACHGCHADMALKTSIFNHASHVARLNDKWSCTQCHEPNRPKNHGNSKPCADCHHEDMGLEASAAGYDYRARSYTDAMHGQCMGCHQRQDEKNGTRMAECGFCHRHQKPVTPGAQKAVSLRTGGTGR
ncbi:MAG: polysulfide reductase NrfD [Polyangiaceae bacterium]|nr:polysulfide reductase NrfD [Polyangiaceae bacterium]